MTKTTASQTAGARQSALMPAKPPTPLPKTCAECFASSSEIQRTSIRNSLSWIHAFFLDVESQSAPCGDMTLSCRTARCDNCPYETPFARDNTLAANTAEPLENLAGVTIETDPKIQEQLLNGANQWALGQMFVDSATTFDFGPFSRHAIIVANNLICGAQPGKSVPGSPQTEGALAQATQPSLNAMRELLESNNASTATVTAGDLITVRWLHEGLKRALDYARANRKNSTTRYRKKRAPAWRIAAGALLALVSGVTMAVIPTHPVGMIAGLMAIVSAIAAGLWWRGRNIEIVDPPPAWITALMDWSSSSEYDEIFRSFASFDVLGNAGALFENTPAGDSGIAASVLRHVHASSGGPQLAKWVVQRVAGCFAIGKHEWISRFGTALLEDDDYSRGTDIAGLLLTEIRNQHHSFEEDGRIWVLLSDECGGRGGMPAFLSGLMRRATVLNRGRVYWSPREGAFIRRCCDAARAWLTRTEITNVNWHLLQVRLLRDMLGRGVSSVQFPPDSGYSLRGICARVEKSFYDHEDSGDESQVYREAKAVLSMRGFRHSCRYLARKFDGSLPPPPYIPRRYPTAMDRELLRRYGRATPKRAAARQSSTYSTIGTDRQQARAAPSQPETAQPLSTVDGLIVSRSSPASKTAKGGRKQRHKMKGKKQSRR